MGGSPANDQLAALAHVQRMSASPGAVAALRAMNKEIDVRAVLSSIAVPTLIFHRTGEPLDVRAARWVADRIPGARFVELEGTVHGLFQEHDLDLVVETMREFVVDASNAPPREESGRVLATVLFTDLVDSTAKAVELGPRWAETLREHNAAIRRELGRYNGREIDTAGDGFFASGFDGPVRAIRCACAIRDAIGALGLGVRIGVHTGECELVDGKLAGLAVVIGARVAAQAEAGEVLVSGTVKDLVAGSGIEFQPRGTRELKGLGEWPVYAVTAA
jgi:class 3 adenylate cyclase